MRRFHNVRELAAAVGTHVGHSAWHTVTQEQVDLFAEATGDHQWIHVDPERSATGPFGGTIAHGFLTLSLTAMLTPQVYAVDGVSLIINYGAERVRFPSPAPVGARLRAGVVLTGLAEHARGHQLATRVTVECEGTDKPVCVVDMLSILVS